MQEAGTNLDSIIADFWPEFAQGGKREMTLGYPPYQDPDGRMANQQPLRNVCGGGVENGRSSISRVVVNTLVTG
jgi:hypothetical protein